MRCHVTISRAATMSPVDARKMLFHIVTVFADAVSRWLPAMCRPPMPAACLRFNKAIIYVPVSSVIHCQHFINMPPFFIRLVYVLPNIATPGAADYHGATPTCRRQRHVVNAVAIRCRSSQDGAPASRH